MRYPWATSLQARPEHRPIPNYVKRDLACGRYGEGLMDRRCKWRSWLEVLGRGQELASMPRSTHLGELTASIVADYPAAPVAHQVRLRVRVHTSGGRP